jgi:hypothetical protein
MIRMLRRAILKNNKQQPALTLTRKVRRYTKCEGEPRAKRLCRKAYSLQDLPDEIHLLIIPWVNLRDAAALRATCTLYRRILHKFSPDYLLLPSHFQQATKHWTVQAIVLRCTRLYNYQIRTLLADYEWPAVPPTTATCSYEDIEQPMNDKWIHPRHGLLACAIPYLQTAGSNVWYLVVLFEDDWKQCRCNAGFVTLEGADKIQIYKEEATIRACAVFIAHNRNDLLNYYLRTKFGFINILQTIIEVPDHCATGSSLLYFFMKIKDEMIFDQCYREVSVTMRFSIDKSRRTTVRHPTNDTPDSRSLWTHVWGKPLMIANFAIRKNVWVCAPK